MSGPMPDAPPPGLFFAGSDDEDGEDDVDMNQFPDAQPPPHSSPSLPHTPRTGSSRSSPPSGKLFLPDDDDDDDDDGYMSVPAELPSSSVQKKRAAAVMLDSDTDDDIQIIENPSPAKYKRSQPANKGKARAVSTPPTPTPKQKAEPCSSPAAKKPRLTTVAAKIIPPAITISPTYLGEVIIPNAWSNVSGKGYIKSGDTVSVRREQDMDAGPSNVKAGANTKSKKQATLTGMLKAQPTKATNLKKKKADTIVRLCNKKGVGA